MGKSDSHVEGGWARRQGKDKCDPRVSRPQSRDGSWAFGSKMTLWSVASWREWPSRTFKSEQRVETEAAI